MCMCRHHCNSVGVAPLYDRWGCAVCHVAMQGIGTGWSTSIPAYNPRDIIEVLRCRLARTEAKKLYPWFRGFNGTLVIKDEQHFATQGVVDLDADVSV